MRSVNSLMEEKLKSDQQTPANKASPQMSIQVSRARSTIMDSDYWTVETIRQKTGLGDVSVAPRRYKPYGRPNRIYEIHVDNGVVGTSIREYPDTFKDGWKDQFTLGSGSSVALAFDGNWQRYRGVWRLVTDEKPWIFWVDSSGILWRQLWDDASTLSQLDTGVSYVRAIRAWRNQYSAELDQGIVVGYIKTDGTVWYRNYCKQADGTVIWEIARVLPSVSGAVHLNLFLTNDYRLGFSIEKTNGDIQWLISQRNWSGMAIDTETLAADISAIEVTLTAIEYITNIIEREELLSTVSRAEVHLCPANMDLGIVESLIVEPNKVELRFLYDVSIDNETKDYFKIKNLGIEKFSVNTEVGSESNILVLTSSEILNPYVETFVTLLDNSTFRLMPSAVCKPVVPAFNHTVQPLPPPPGYAWETLEPSINAINLTFTWIDWITNHIDQHSLEASISNVTVVLTKVGTEPI